MAEEPPPRYELYFAYGSNMLEQRLKDRLGSALPTRPFSGLQLMCLMYAGFKCIAPDQDTGTDLNEPWITALELFNAGKSSEGY